MFWVILFCFGFKFYFFFNFIDCLFGSFFFFEKVIYRKCLWVFFVFFREVFILFRGRFILTGFSIRGDGIFVLVASGFIFIFIIR